LIQLVQNANGTGTVMLLTDDYHDTFLAYLTQKHATNHSQVRVGLSCAYGFHQQTSPSWFMPSYPVLPSPTTRHPFSIRIIPKTPPHQKLKASTTQTNPPPKHQNHSFINPPKTRFTMQRITSPSHHKAAKKSFSFRSFSAAFLRCSATCSSKIASLLVTSIRSFCVSAVSPWGCLFLMFLACF
jgi:hypothetical protein